MTAWPLVLRQQAALGVDLDFMSYKQSLPAGQEVREWIIENVTPVNRAKVFAAAQQGVTLPSY